MSPLPNVACSAWQSLLHEMLQSNSPLRRTSTLSRPLKVTFMGVAFASLVNRRLSLCNLLVVGVPLPPWVQSFVIILVLLAMKSPLNMALGGEKEIAVNGHLCANYLFVRPRKGVTLLGEEAPKHNLVLEEERVRLWPSRQLRRFTVVARLIAPLNNRLNSIPI